MADAFVLVESDATHSGRPKALLFDANRPDIKCYIILYNIFNIQ